MIIKDLKVAVIGNHPVVRITTDEGIDGIAAAECHDSRSRSFQHLNRSCWAGWQARRSLASAFGRHLPRPEENGASMRRVALGTVHRWLRKEYTDRRSDDDRYQRAVQAGSRDQCRKVGGADVCACIWHSCLERVRVANACTIRRDDSDGGGSKAIGASRNIH